jgi:hypothetical protein
MKNPIQGLNSREKMTSKSRKKRTRAKKKIINSSGTVRQRSTSVKAIAHSNLSEQTTPKKSIIENKTIAIRDHHIISELKRIGILAGVILAILVALAFVIT